MPCYRSLSKEELSAKLAEFQKEYEAMKSKKLSLNMARGKPGADQLDLSMGMLTCLNSSDCCKLENGTDSRNYGLVDGIPEAKRLFSEILDVKPSNIIVGGNSSLNMMYDNIARAMTHGVLGSTPWCRLKKVKFLCPSPGYDRHFAICEHFGIEMIPVEMLKDGPDMDAVASLVESDESVKGIWCVPKYSNPEGKTYSDAVVDRFAALKPAAGDFRIFWDNAYCVHHLTDRPDHLKNILTACRETGRENMVYEFASTSKITFPGAGVAAMAASEANIADITEKMKAQTIGPDKLNQLRHVRFFKNLDGVSAHMKKHAAILKPKFDAVLSALDKELSGTGLAEWTRPDGGYFISLDTMDGCAKRTVALCREAGVAMTPAGASYPYGKDPRDRNIRIAPTYPPLNELKTAIGLFCLCIKIAGTEKLLHKAD